MSQSVFINVLFLVENVIKIVEIMKENFKLKQFKKERKMENF